MKKTEIRRCSTEDRFCFGHSIYLYIIVLIVLCIASCEKSFEESKFLMGTMVEITAVGGEQVCQQAVRLAFEEIRMIDGLMDIHSEDSEISRINRAAGESAVQVSTDTLKVINESLRFGRLTDGALDITIAPLMELWGFRNGTKQIPPDDELREKLSLVDYRQVLVDADRLTVKLGLPGMQIDVSAIAKGYAVDRAIQILRNEGIRSALVNAGGDIYALGSSPKKRPWRVGIRHPRRSADLLGIMELEDEAVATSGDYENFFEVDGKRYCHIINAKTGRPVEGIASVTIVADNTAEADALATAVFPLGAEDGMKLIESMEGMDGIIVTGKKEEDLEILMSSGMKDRVQLRVDQKTALRSDTKEGGALGAIREEGVVIEANDKTATVQIDKTSACAHCKAGCINKGGVMVTEAENSIGAGAGDTVRLEFKPGAALTAIMMVFGLPLLALLLGAVLGAIVASQLGYQDPNHLLSIGIGAILFFAAFIPVWLYDRYMRKSGSYTVAVVKILKKRPPGSAGND